MELDRYMYCGGDMMNRFPAGRELVVRGRHLELVLEVGDGAQALTTAVASISLAKSTSRPSNGATFTHGRSAVA